MLRKELTYSILLITLFTAPLSAQNTPVPAQTPPIPPRTVDTPVPSKVTLPPPPTVTPETGARPLTAAEAVQIALRLQPTIQAAREGINAAKGRTQQTRAGLLPGLNLNLSYNNVSTLTGNSTGSGATGGTGTTNTNTVGGQAGFQTSGVVRQLIFDFNHTRDLVRQNALLEQAATQNLSRTQNDLTLQVKQAFYQYQQNLRLVQVNEANVQNRQSQRELARARLNSGLGLPSDVVTAETALSDSVLGLNLAQNNSELARVTLAALMGIDPRTPFELAPGSEVSPNTDDLNALVQTALRQRPEMLQAEATIQSNQSGLRAARTTNAPSISANVGTLGRGDDWPFRNDSFSAGVSIVFSPFDGGLTAGRVREAQANLATAQANLTSARLTVISDVSQAYLNLRTAEQRVATAAIAVTNAQEGVRIAEGRYRAGLGLFLDIINAQSLLLTARTNQVTAEALLEQARAALQRATGFPVRTGGAQPAGEAGRKARPVMPANPANP